MFYVFTALGILLLLLAAFIVWRYMSVARGAQQRDEKQLLILGPIAQKLEAKDEVTPEEVADLARRPQLRPMLHTMLSHFDRLDLFPIEHLSIAAQAEAQLVYWMMHPNELQDAPHQIELVESFTRPTSRGEPAEILVFRYKMAEGHWAAKDGWLLGLAGPYRKSEAPYVGLAGAFSRCTDKHGEVEPSELVDWYLDMARQKGAPF